MKVHIVQSNESLEGIARKYDITVEDIIKNNLHISNVYNILPGMKLRLPILSEDVKEKFRENTIDIKEYYPTIEDFNEYDQQTKKQTKSQEVVEGEEEVEYDDLFKQEESKSKAEVSINKQNKNQPYAAYSQQQSQQQPQYNIPYHYYYAQYQQQNQPYYTQPNYQMPQQQPSYQVPYRQSKVVETQHDLEHRSQAKPIKIDLRKNKL